MSFVHDLYTPRYIKRPVVEVRETTGVLPPVAEAGVETEVVESYMADLAAFNAPLAAPPARVAAMKMMKAAERDSSVSGLVREFLTELAGGESDFARRRRLQDEVLATVHRFQGSRRLTRDQVHSRRAVR